MRRHEDQGRECRGENTRNINVQAQSAGSLDHGQTALPWRCAEGHRRFGSAENRSLPEQQGIEFSTAVRSCLQIDSNQGRALLSREKSKLKPSAALGERCEPGVG